MQGNEEQLSSVERNSIFDHAQLDHIVREIFSHEQRPCVLGLRAIASKVGMLDTIRV